MVLGLLTGAVTGAAKLLGGKEKKSGAKMASAIVKREPQQDAVEKKQPEIKVKTKVVSVSSLMDTKSLESESKKQSKKSSGVDSVDAALDNIDSTLDGLRATIKSSSQFQKNEMRRKNRRRIQEGKKEKEEEQESKKKVPRFGMKVPRPFKSAFDTIKNFFSNILLGSLAIWILNNITTIMSTIKDVYEKMREIVKKVGKFLTPVWNIFKWIVEGFSPSGLELVNAILSDQNTRDLMDASKIAEVDDLYNKKLTDRIKEIEGSFKGIEKSSNDARMKSEVAESPMGDVSSPPPIIQPQTYTLSTLVPLLKSVGATDDEAVRLAAIGMHESSGNPKARNIKHPDDSYGLFQINMLDEPGYKLGEERRKKYNIANSDLLNPYVNASIALDILRTQGVSAWSTNKMVTPAQLQKGRESLNTRNLIMGDQSSIKNLPQQAASLMVIPSYGNTTIVAVTDNSQSSPAVVSGSSETTVVPLFPSRKQVMLNNYEYSVTSSLWKIG